MRRLLILVLVVGTVAAAIVGAGPAGAQATFVGTPTTFYVGTVTGLVLNVPHELEPEFYNVEVALQIPVGWQATSCISKPTWECGIADEDGHQVIRWIKTGGPGEDETFEFWIVAANSVGSYAFPTVQWYSNGHESAWVGPPGSPSPAPVLSTIPLDAPPPTTPVTPPITHGTPGGGLGGTAGIGGPAGPNPALPGLAAPATTPDGDIVPFPNFGPRRSTTTVRRTTEEPSSSAQINDGTEDEERFAPGRSPRQESDQDEDDDEAIDAALTSGSSDSGGGIPPGLFAIPALLLVVALGAYSSHHRPVDPRR